MTPTARAWVGPEIVPEVVFTRVLAPWSVGPDDLVLHQRNGPRVAGEVKSDAERLRFIPAQPLAEGFYVLSGPLDVEAHDGSVLPLLAMVPIEFSVRPSAAAWTEPSTLGPSPPAAAAPVFSADTIGGASLAWLHEGDVLVADYGRESGWTPGVSIDRIPSNQPAEVLLARGAGTVVAGTAMANSGVTGDTLLRVRWSRGFLRNGTRAWETALLLLSLDVAIPPQVHVDAAGRPFVLAASRRMGRTELRVLWLDGPGEESISGVAESFAIDAVLFGARGDVAIAWTQTTGSERRHWVRVHRAARFDPAFEIGAAPRAGGLGSDGNAWLLLQDGPTRAVYLTQEDGQWTATRPTLPAGLAHVVGRARDLVQVSWRSESGLETLIARHYDRLGRVLGERVLAGPTNEPLWHMALAGDADAELIAVWREGQGVKVARARRESAAALTWSPAAYWQDEHLPIPIERARLTPLAYGLGITWVENDRLATSFLTPFRLAPLPAVNPRPPSTGTPLVDETFLATANGTLLVLWHEGGLLRGQALR